MRNAFKKYLKGERNIFIDPEISLGARQSYVNEGPAYNSLAGLFLELGGKVIKGLIKGLTEEDLTGGKYYGPLQIGKKIFHLANSAYIGEFLDKNGGKSDEINLGAQHEGVKLMNPFSAKYGVPPGEVAIHETLHEKFPNASEAEITQAARMLAQKYEVALN
jgi:hypothetical protein